MDTCPPRASVSAVNISQHHHQPRSTANSPTASPDMHHRPLPTVRSLSSLSPSVVSSRVPTPRHSPLLPSFPKPNEKFPLGSDYQPVQQQQQPQHPSICGLPLKYVSLVTLAVQNAALSIVMHYSRVSTPPALAYSPASAVLLNELLKGSISFFIALLNSPLLNPASSLSTYQHPLTRRHRALSWPAVYWHAFADLCGEVFSPDAWKLSIPAILYVIQNSLQFVAIANLPVASFQVTYQMKILTTAAFSVALLRRKLSTTKWLSLFFLAIGVGIVQIQTTMGGSVTTKASSATEAAVGSAHEYHMHTMNPLKGFGAVTAACFTSGLAGVYFEMVLKGSKADLWVRNVQLSLFSLIPALLPILYAAPHPDSRGFLSDLFRHFGGWAWATVAIQVVGGLVTAVVIKYSDNILKGFATSLSIVLSFLASVALFDFHITPSFVIGASTVLGATWMYNQPAPPCAPASASAPSSLPSSVPSSPMEKDLSFSIVLNDASPTSSGKSSPSASPYYPSTPLDTQNASASASVLGLGVGSFMRRKSGGFSSNSRNSSTASLSALLSSAASSNSLASDGTGSAPGRGTLGLAESGELVHPPDGLRTADGTPFSSKPPSRLPSRASTPCPSPTAPTHFAPGFGPFARSASGERMGNGSS